MKKILVSAVVLLTAAVSHAQTTSPPDSAAPSTTAPSTTSPSTAPPPTGDMGTTDKEPAVAPSGSGTSSMGMDENSSSWPGTVTVLSVEQGKRTEAQSNLTNGQQLEHVNLPSKCVSSNEQAMLNGQRQVLFGFTLPANTNAKITVTPRSEVSDKEMGKDSGAGTSDKSASTGLNVYAYTQSSSRYDLPSQQTALWNSGDKKGTGTGTSSSEIECKTSFAGKTGLTKAVKGSERTIKIDGKKMARNVVIGVAAPAGATSEDFVIAIDAKKE